MDTGAGLQGAYRDLPILAHAPCSASTYGDQMLTAAEFDFPLSGTHA